MIINRVLVGSGLLGAIFLTVSGRAVFHLISAMTEEKIMPETSIDVESVWGVKGGTEIQYKTEDGQGLIFCDKNSRTEDSLGSEVFTAFREITEENRQELIQYGKNSDQYRIVLDIAAPNGLPNGAVPCRRIKEIRAEIISMNSK
ncbi:MAG: hypothetical protein LBH81_03430 [Rickettsiales bacterium]|jgi:hypothetical protein|nr:hypothetical protein [Rickettsiales bacterium]